MTIVCKKGKLSEYFCNVTGKCEKMAQQEKNPGNLKNIEFFFEKIPTTENG